MLLIAISQWLSVPALASDQGAMIEAEERGFARGLVETTLEGLVLASDVVVIGTIIEERRRDALLTSPTPSSVELWRVRVEETVSGLVENGTVDVIYRSDWYSGMRGRTVLVFGRQMPLPVGHGWGDRNEAPVVLADILVPTEFGALFLYSDEDDGHWAPSVYTEYVPWLPDRPERTGATWPDFLDGVREAARQTGAHGYTVPGAHLPSVLEDESRAVRVLRELDYGPFELPEEPPPVSERLAVSSAPLRFNAAEMEAAKSAFGAPERKGTRFVPERLTLMHLYAQASAYHLALLAVESPHAGEVRELNMRILGLVAGGPLSAKHVGDIACEIAMLPRDCAPNAFPTCGTYERLHQTAEALCAKPTEHRDKVCSQPSDFGLEGRGWCVGYRQDSTVRLVDR